MALRSERITPVLLEPEGRGAEASVQVAAPRPGGHGPGSAAYSSLPQCQCRDGAARPRLGLANLNSSTQLVWSGQEATLNSLRRGPPGPKSCFDTQYRNLRHRGVVRVGGT
eukprot:3625255-Rhodomonas_salina.1